MRLRAWLSFLLLLDAGCSFNSSGISPTRSADAATAKDAPLEQLSAERASEDRSPDRRSDRRPGDSKPTDGKAPDRKPIDQRAPDQKVPDQKVPDQEIPDKQAPDTVPHCLAKYGNVSIPSFKLCPAPSGVCAFYYTSGSCDTMCAKGGGTCIKSLFDTSDGCETSGDESCSYVHSDAVCHCSF